MMSYVMQAFNKYAVFEGRSSRSEYWYFVLFNFLVGLVLGVVDSVSGLVVGEGTGILGTIYSLATLVPSIAVGVRRMHDVGKSGWFLLIPIYNLILAVTDSEHGSNRFGPNPHGIGNDDDYEMMEHLIEE